VSALDLIVGFKGDVELLLAKARRLLNECAQYKPRSDCEQAACHWSDERVAQLDATVGPIAAMERGTNMFEFSNKPGGHWDLWAFTLAFAYHKLVPVCSKSDPVDSVGVLQKTKPNFVCTSDEIQRHEAAGDHEGQVAYDLMPFDEQAGYCHGPSCKRAVAALDAYRQLLHVLTPFRTALLKSLVQRSCPFEHAEFVEQMRWLNTELPRVSKGLLDAKESIVSSCVVPSRHDL